MDSIQDGSPSHDDVDPRSFFDSNPRGRTRNKKTRMLCSQVADCLQLVLDSGVSDADLQELWLAGVEPFPDAGTLRVTVNVDDRVRIDFALEVGQLTETIEVTAVAPLLQSDYRIVRARGVRAPSGLLF